MSISIMNEEQEIKIQPVDEDNIEDWDYYLKDPPISKVVRIITMKAKYIGRAKPLPYYLEYDE